MSTLLDRKCCGTCEHWQGSREATRNGVRCKNANDEGICGNRKCSQHDKGTKAGYHCANKYEQWSQYKG